VIALVLSLFLLSLIGIPPLGGFMGKFYVFGAAVRSGYVGLVVLGVLNTTIAAYYYLRLIVYMYMREPEAGGASLTPSFAGGLALTVSLIGVVVFGVMPAPFIDLARAAVSPLLR
jgi:NADH-quinone oxidoreductase subunit N